MEEWSGNASKYSLCFSGNILWMPFHRNSLLSGLAWGIEYYKKFGNAIKNLKLPEESLRPQHLMHPHY